MQEIEEFLFIKYFFILLSKFRYNFTLTIFKLLIMSVFGGFLELLGIAMIFPVMLVLTSSNSTGGEFVISQCSKIFKNQSDMQIAFFLAVLMFLIFFLKNLFMMVCINEQNDFAKKWQDRVNFDLVKKFLNSSFLKTSFFDYGEKVTLLSSIVRDISLDFLLRGIILFANGIVALCILALLFYKFTLPAFLSTLFILIWVYFENNFFKGKAKKLGEIGAELLNGLNKEVDFVIKSQKEIIISNKQEYFIKRLSETSKKLSQNRSKEISYGNFPLYVTEIGVIFAFLIMTTSIVLMPEISKAAIISSLAIIGLMVLRLVPQLNKVLISMYAINVSKQKVFQFLSMYETISNNTFEPLLSDEKIEFQNEISLKNVSFEYEKNKPVLSDINLNIKKGEFIGIIGASGAGKTTLAGILSGLFNVENGQFMADDIEIKADNLLSYRKLISYLPQESVFIDDTVLKNVAWGVLENEIDETKVKKALELAGLNIEPNSSMELSLGQKKRVALARAYYSDFEILLLDEATASLDVESENVIVENILKLKGKKTVIAIAHRLSTLKECDKIVYLVSGKIKDIGTFEELGKRNLEIDEMLKKAAIS